MIYSRKRQKEIKENNSVEVLPLNSLIKEQEREKKQENRKNINLEKNKK